ncbi:MAG: sigma-54-dependent Fis family transcriptional regulator [Bacteroidaceae bacterium]|nr:sigma-54-dependent Fis family transcriptional regulator [Bacteroidaceae bacterium]
MDMNNVKMRYGIVGQDEQLYKALDTAIQIAPTDLTVLIQGESGVGKEVIPRIIHDCSKRRNKRYIAINCGSIPEGTIDSELFGHEKGSFTGAIGEREGYFGAANGGTLFLDEVGELPMSTQARLLRVLETGEYIRVGSSEPRVTDVRIVAATNVNIPNAIREGKFREDLYYRLCTINIKMPALRDRGRDSVLLFKKFTLDTAEKYNIPTPLRLTPEAEEVITSYKWPGNVRQLKNVAEQMSILCTDRVVTPQILAEYGVVPNMDESTAVACTKQPSSHTSHRDYENEIKMLASAVLELRHEVNELKSMLQHPSEQEEPQTALVPAPIHASALPIITQPMPSELDVDVDMTHPHLPQSHSVKSLHAEIHPEEDDIQTAEEIVEHESLNLIEMEKRLIMKALQRHHFRRKNAADELGISERTLYRKIKDYGIED